MKVLLRSDFPCHFESVKSWIKYHKNIGDMMWHLNDGLIRWPEAWGCRNGAVKVEYTSRFHKGNRQSSVLCHTIPCCTAQWIWGKNKPGKYLKASVPSAKFSVHYPTIRKRNEKHYWPKRKRKSLAHLRNFGKNIVWADETSVEVFRLRVSHYIRYKTNKALLKKSQWNPYSGGPGAAFLLQDLDALL